MLFHQKHIYYLQAIERAGSMTEAANQVFISQPALSQVVKQVEAELGAPIFDRSSSPLKLTQVGRIYLDTVRQLSAIQERMMNHINDIKGEVHGTVRLGISLQRGVQILPRVLPEFLRRYPHVHVELEEYGSNTLERMVLDQTCDMALITTEPSNPRLRYRLIENEEILLIASPLTDLARRIKSGTPISLLEARNEKFVSLSLGHSIRAVQDRLFLMNDIRPRIILESHNFEVCRRLTAAMNAVMLCPDVYLSRVPDLDLSRTVSYYPITDADLKRHFYLCDREDTHSTSYLDDFYVILLERLGHGGVFTAFAGDQPSPESTA